MVLDLSYNVLARGILRWCDGIILDDRIRPMRSHCSTLLDDSHSGFLIAVMLRLEADHLALRLGTSTDREHLCRTYRRTALKSGLKRIWILG